MAERDPEILDKLDLVVSLLKAQDDRLRAMEARQERTEAWQQKTEAWQEKTEAWQRDVQGKVAQMEDAQQAMRGDIREVKGQLSIMLTWLQSMDQRFSALMAPVTPPRKPAAE
ncbi:hypothetical protein [Azospirillum sp.]|uniref:hypothetical protein n=1 Tax=Azospirillum sp. TaxID=34012 RepID=UPI002D4211AD|nr:hypothetical protein [Azospirillum sp.]HYD67471.1 hypothetical protein [Azospirillum sp.]